MVPLHDDNPTRSKPYVTYALIGLNIAVFLFEIGLSPQGLELFFDRWAVVPAQLTASFQGAGFSAGQEWLTLISSQFLHGGFLHLGGNMLYLWVFGNNIEDRLGKIKFIIFYLGCGVLAALTQWFFEPGSPVPTVGASGAIAGVMGAYILKFPKARILTLIPLFVFITTIRIPALFFLGFWFVQQALYGIASLGAEAQMGTGGVAYWAHAGGFIFGIVLGPLLGLLAETDPPSPYR
ncbi:MAG: rhomboid family intramembrane serine protease [Leptolyngbyaceae cyanobacterium SL_1_1]|nr:rhomboid family intramembrane serine protease [Leptolyngbyaceae cyanobacterium RM1_1_2]NJO11685.1 rhomboid family intramembrane serine protease [Leptolyngbyaceae cyanobacterium SL_1_1]